MHKSLDIDEAVRLLKKLVENVRCAVCDKTGGNCMRYACGHTSCEECAVVASSCSFCLTPPLVAAGGPVLDKPFTERAENAVNLLNVFQNEFHVDVYKRQRVSAQLKIEKELFPECIQAPAKYYNKRKSFKNSKNNKENKLSQLPGEEIASVLDNKMEQSNENVELWLNKCIRKPFADLNSNDDRLRKRIRSKKNTMDHENNITQRSNRKRPFRAELSVVNSQSILDRYLTPVKKKVYKKNNIESETSKFDTSNYFNAGNSIKADNDESGIVMDDEAIIIDDSQSVRADKDFSALIAVHNAENNEQDPSPSVISEKSHELDKVNFEKSVEAKSNVITKVPFFLKSYLSGGCVDCNRISVDSSDAYKAEPTKDISITVDSKCFTATIKVTTIEDNKKTVRSMQSVEVQTDIIETVTACEELISADEDVDIAYESNVKECVQKNSFLTCNSQSQDLFEDDSNNRRFVLKPQNVVIEESDSDDELASSVSLVVTADVHRSSEDKENGILFDVENLEEHSKRPRRAARGLTPISTDSSDKENYNPNRQKKEYASKKKSMKK